MSPRQRMTIRQGPLVEDSSRIDRSTAYLLPTIALVMGVIACDLILKWQMTEWLGVDADVHAWWLVDGLVGFEYARNSGAAFGLFQGNPQILAAISVLVAFGFCWLIFAEIRARSLRIACSGLIVGGAIGNLIERVRHGYVTDFLAAGSFPRFNLADSAITVGVVIFVIAVVFMPDDRVGHEHENAGFEGRAIRKSTDLE